MTKVNFITLSAIAFLSVVVVNSAIYIQYDFLNHDVKGATSFYGWVQFVIALVSVVIIVLNINKKQKHLLWVLYLLFTMLLLMQILPAFLWFLFNGKIINDKPYDGVTGNWIFGAYHLIIIAWGFLNINKYRTSIASTSSQ